MKPSEAYAAYTAAILGHPVEDAEAKFNALASTERDAWEAVASLGVRHVRPTKTAPKLAPKLAPPSV